MSARMQAVLDAIDAANAADPNLDDGMPEAQLYGKRMSEELNRQDAEREEMEQQSKRMRPEEERTQLHGGSSLSE